MFRKLDTLWSGVLLHHNDFPNLLIWISIISFYCKIILSPVQATITPAFSDIKRSISGIIIKMQHSWENIWSFILTEAAILDSKIKFIFFVEENAEFVSSSNDIFKVNILYDNSIYLQSWHYSKFLKKINFLSYFLLNYNPFSLKALILHIETGHIIFLRNKYFDSNNLYQ